MPSTGVPPCELLMHRTLRSLLDCAWPNVSGRMLGAQMRQKHHHDRKARQRSFADGGQVFCRDFGRGTEGRWIPAIVDKAEPNQRWFFCRLPDGREVRRHADHMRLRREPKQQPETIEASGSVPDVMPQEEMDSWEASGGASGSKDSSSGSKGNDSDSNDNGSGSNDSCVGIASSEPRRSGRERRMPDRLRYD